MRKIFFLALMLGAVALSSCHKNDPELVGFSINADGGMVTFAPGNLQYQASTDTWQFAANQYDYIGDDNANIDGHYTGWIDLFGWGTGGENPTLYTELAESYRTFTDWGANAILNGKKTDKAGTWRTLTCEEWVYIFETRPNASSLRFKATVCGVAGLILLPDGWVIPDGISYNVATTDFDVNNFEAVEWATMESAGAVFFPAAGYRESGSIYSTNYEAYYWSSTPDQNEVAAFAMYFGQVNVYARNLPFRWDGCCVRLVKDAK